MNEIFQNLYEMTAFSNIIAEPQFLIMYAIAFILLYLGIKNSMNRCCSYRSRSACCLPTSPEAIWGVIQADENGMIKCTE